MALEIKNDTIIGTINNLQEKLNGELLIDRLELLYLVNSWGREEEFYTIEGIYIKKCEATQCYDLSKLDTSEITDMSQLFQWSEFNDIHSTNGIGLHNGDISNWNVSKVTDMYRMFAVAYNFNQALNDWNVSNVTDMRGMFLYAKSFNQALNDWDVSNVTDMNYMFRDASNFNQVLNWNVSNVTDMWAMFSNAIAFKTKFNNGKSLPNYTSDLKQWLKENRDSDRMLAIDIKEREKDNLDSFYNNLEILYNNLDKENNI